MDGAGGKQTFKTISSIDGATTSDVCKEVQENNAFWMRVASQCQPLQQKQSCSRMASSNWYKILKATSLFQPCSKYVPLVVKRISSMVKVGEQVQSSRLTAGIQLDFAKTQTSTVEFWIYNANLAIKT